MLTIAQLAMIFGVAQLAIFISNTFMVISELKKYTPDWSDAETSQEEIISNFLSNATPERIQFIINVAQLSTFFLMSALFFICGSFFL